MKEVIDGTLVPFTELRDVTDWLSIRKVFVTDLSTRSNVIHPFPPEVSQAQ